MDYVMMIWVLFAGVVPPLVLGYVMYRYGQQQGEKQYKLVKKEIQTYIEEELPKYILKQLQGMFGPIGKEGAKMTREEALEWGQKNPGILSLMKNVAVRGGARWAGKNVFGMTKNEVDMIIHNSILGSPQEPGESIIQPVQGQQPYSQVITN